MINIGAYKAGSNKNIDFAIAKIEQVNDFLMQSTEDKFDFEEITDALSAIFVEA